MRKYKTGSGATGVQVCYKEFGKVVKTIQIGSAHSEQGIRRLEKKARQVMNAGQGELFKLERFEKKDR